MQRTAAQIAQVWFSLLHSFRGVVPVSVLHNTDLHSVFQLRKSVYLSENWRDELNKEQEGLSTRSGKTLGDWADVYISHATAPGFQ